MIFGALLGLSVLAKGLVGPALAGLALLIVCWDRGLRLVVRDLLHWRTLAPFAAVAVPWYALCFARNGTPFLEEFFLLHHLERFATESLQHVQPIWFYVPVLLVGLLPLLSAPRAVQLLRVIVEKEDGPALNAALAGTAGLNLGFAILFAGGLVL